MRIKSLCALFAALTAICSQLMISLPSLVPINMATLSIFICACLLGSKYGALSQFVYVLIGLIGVPVFSGFRAGPATLFGPTGGYIIGYIAAAFVIGFSIERKPSKYMLPFAMIIGLALCYAIGTVWYMFSMQIELLPAIMSCVVPFLFGDAIKIAVACVVVKRIGILYLHKITSKNYST